MQAPFYYTVVEPDVLGAGFSAFVAIYSYQEYLANCTEWAPLID